MKQIFYQAQQHASNFATVTNGNDFNDGASPGSRAGGGGRSLLRKWMLLAVVFVGMATAGFGQSGSCGANLTWQLSSGTLTISGTGAMTNYSSSSSVSWDMFCSQITKVVINNGVTSIGNYVFSGCSNLFSITIPSSVTGIGDYVFFGCSKLTSVTIPSSVASIGSSAFYGCSKLTSVTIPSSVASIGSSAFYNCSSLAFFEVDGSNPNYSSEDGVLFNKNKTTLLCYPCGKPGAYIISSSVTRIGSNAFYNCNSLTSIIIPSSVTSIESNAFYSCSSLAFFEVDGANPGYSSEDGVLFNKNKTTLFCYPCGKPGAYIIPSSVTRIEGSAFRYCISLTSITIPSSVTFIGSSAFYYCISLTSVTISSGVTSIGDYTFYYCSSLTSVTIPSGVTSIGNYAFYNCSNLTSITIPSSVTSIGSSAFSGCTKLESITMPLTPCQSLKNVGELFLIGSSNQVITGYIQTYSAEGKYYYVPSSLKEIRINKVAGLLDSFFQNVDLSITITSACTTIPVGMLSSATKLKQLTLPFIGISPTATGESAVLGALFGTTTSSTGITQYYAEGKSNKYAIPATLKKLTITSPATQIGYGALYGCSMLEELTIGSSVLGVGNKALYGCYALKDIYVHNAAAPVAYEGISEGVYSMCVLHVPAGRKNHYSSRIGWKEFLDCGGIQEEAPLVITTASIPLNGGVISGSGQYNYEDNVSLSAIGNWGYQFKYWMEGDNTVSNSNPYTFSATAPRTLHAVFEPRENENTVVVAPQSVSANIVWDAVEGAASYLLEIYADANRTQLLDVIHLDANGNTMRSTTQALSHNLSDLTSATAYYYTLTAYNVEDQKLSVSIGGFATTGSSGIDDPATDSKIVLYPNPVRDRLYIRSATPIENVTIYNLEGLAVETHQSDMQNGGEQYIDVSHLPKGIYLVKIQGKNGVVTKRTIVE